LAELARVNGELDVAWTSVRYDAWCSGSHAAIIEALVLVVTDVLVVTILFIVGLLVVLLSSLSASSSPPFSLSSSWLASSLFALAEPDVTGVTRSTARSNSHVRNVIKL
jgi:uncharacterized protein (DUF58 family)